MTQIRCPWPKQDPLYVAYHDEEWGIPEWESQALFEKLILDGFQAGLSWITILRKRDNFRTAFKNFDPHKVSRWTEKDVERLMQNEGIVRNRAKIESSIKSARAYLEIEEREGFDQFLWQFLEGRPKQNTWRTMKDVPTETEVSKKMSKALKAEGFNFCGPTITYAFMQAVGMVNDHMVDCFCHARCAKLSKGKLAPRKLEAKKV